ncbi:DNA-3-methyladenine glycosylase family protein [Bryobacter aggregatus]|uniref:DNA-3-methyladenine glycosylase family protein n=1 Tax=Bryobacter aggregatus TaxID=360054 RepID=UPI001EE17CBA|nr:DNA-3-methyladenine glycosylase 2 family protein [Bryobacter aggregatus]
MTYHAPTFHALARAIVYQQLSGKAAATIFRRFQDSCGVRTLNPHAVLAVEEERMRAAGLSGQKARYIRDLAEKTATGLVRFGRHKKMSDEEVIAELTQVKGIGVWTVQMFLMFALQRPDVFPVLDLGVRTGMQRLYGIDAKAKHPDYEALAERWKPYRSLASWYLWRSLEMK